MGAQQAGANWQGMASVPRDGTRVLVAIYASEQGPAEIDIVRWTGGDAEGWVAVDSGPGARVSYVDAEVFAWMPLPAPPPPPAQGQRSRRTADQEEIDGSAI